MQKTALFLIAALLLSCRVQAISAQKAILVDAETGRVLFEKNADARGLIASTTKIMTALVALRTYEMDEVVSFTWDDIGFLEYGDAHIGIKPDEKVNMEDCMYAMLFASANEVSHAIGAHYEGGYDAFLAEMEKELLQWHSEMILEADKA